MKKLLSALFIIALCLSFVACSPAAETAKIEMDTIEITDYENPIIQFSLPKDGPYIVSEFSYNKGLEVRNEDFCISFKLASQQKYVDGSAVPCSYQEMIDYRKDATSGYTFYEVSYSGMNGYAQDSESGSMFLYFPIADSLQNSNGSLDVFEVYLSHKGDEMKMAADFEESRKALDEFVATEEVQMILNSIKLLPGQS